MASLDFAAHGLAAFPRQSLTALRRALLRDHGPEAAGALQEAGYAGGETVYTAFTAWLAERTDIDAEQLDVEAFQHRASEFFSEFGWGTLSVGSIDDAVATLDATDWWEGDGDEQLDSPGCHLTTGLFADLFGRLAGTQVAVLEVECRSMGHEHCRFLVGSPEVLEFVYEDMAEGASYNDAVAAAARST
ncbi:MAG TPA: V4R domain-containing protein [Gemmatimonadaceae bacterium]|nr:V4R domain-containing protein [Gemmatimonadaceae bacterium]